ncbi:MAG: hypothetical protein ACYC33_05410 [Thermoleophilia bacterium]
MATTIALAIALVGVGCSATSEGGATVGASTTATVGVSTTTTSSPTGATSTTSTTIADLGSAELIALLTPEDVQAETGLADVRRAGRNPERRLGGDLNFVGVDGTPLLMVVVQPEASYEEWKADTDSFRDELEGLGEAAFTGPARTMNEAPYLVVLRAEGRTIGLLTYDDPDSEGWGNMITMDQLQALARVIIGRL